MVTAVSKHVSNLEQLAAKCSKSWAHLADAHQRASQEKAKIEAELSRQGLIPADTAFIVFGSLARGELTAGSDVDWTLLVDGPADEAHLKVAQEITRHLKASAYEGPGRTAMFGGLAFSHDLIHRIGGEHDTNRNTTQRILLLLESECIGSDRLVRDRVIRQLLKRYVEEDHEYRPFHDRKPQIPRFLLNDVVRYWRTLAVDSAAKRREREGEAWALRNFKLRMSRKLIFAAGLAACVSCKLRPPGALHSEKLETDDDFCSAMTEFLFDRMSCTPLEILARTVLDFNAIEAGHAIYDAYDKFLAILADPEQRAHLKALEVEDASADSLFQDAREIGQRFQEGLTKLFFGTDEELTKTTQRDGVF